MIEWYYYKCEECSPREGNADERDFWREGRVRRKFAARMMANRHDMREHDGAETAEVVEA